MIDCAASVRDNSTCVEQARRDTSSERIRTTVRTAAKTA